MTSQDISLSPAIAAMHELAQQSYPNGALYVVATPIGNTGDITLRALHVLTIADAVACEDTRNTGHLLQRYGLSKELIPAHQHNEREAAQRVIERLQSGARIALVSDAGTPAVSDPGARIVQAVVAAGLRVVPMPGPSAAIAALSVSGLIADQFHFIGFLPARTSQRDTLLQSVANWPGTLVLYEAPHRIAETAAALEKNLGGARRVVIARELTKLFEQVAHLTLATLSDWLAADGNRTRGEFVLLVEGAQEHAQDQQETDRLLKILLEECPVKQAATLAAKITGQKKNALYERALQLKQGD